MYRGIYPAFAHRKRGVYCMDYTGGAWSRILADFPAQRGKPLGSDPANL